MDCLHLDILFNITQYFNDNTAMRFFATSSSFLKWGKKNFVIRGYYPSTQAINGEWRYTKLKQYHHQIPIPQGVTELEDTRHITIIEPKDGEYAKLFNIINYEKECIRLNDEFVKGLPTSIHTLKLRWHYIKEYSMYKYKYGNYFGHIILPDHIRRLNMCWTTTYEHHNFRRFIVNLTDEKKDGVFDGSLIVAPKLESFVSNINPLVMYLHSNIKNLSNYRIANGNKDFLNIETLTCYRLKKGDVFPKLRKWILNIGNKLFLVDGIAINCFPVLEKLYINVNNSPCYAIELFSQRLFPNLKVLTVCSSGYKSEVIKKSYRYLKGVEIRTLDHPKTFKDSEF